MQSIDSESIERIWKAVTAPKVLSHPGTVRELTEKILKQGWADFVDLSDLLWAFDGRLNIPIGKLATAFNIPKRSIFPRPTRRQETVWGQQMMSAEDAANLLINFERLGFEADPLVLANPLVERKKRAKYLNDAELNLSLFSKERHKREPLILVENPKSIGRLEKEFKTSTNYRVELSRNEDGKAVMLVAFPPLRRRHQKPPLFAA